MGYVEYCRAAEFVGRDASADDGVARRDMLNIVAPPSSLAEMPRRAMAWIDEAKCFSLSSRWEGRSLSDGEGLRVFSDENATYV